MLVESLLDQIRRRINPAPTEYASFSMAEEHPRRLWAELNQYPMNYRDHRLVVVRDVEKVKSWELYHEWINSRHIPQVHAVLIDGRHDVDTKQDHIAATVKSGRFVKAGPTSQDDIKDIVSALHAMTPDVAEAIADRTADIREAIDVTNKLRLLHVQATPALVEALTETNRTDDFTESLLGLRKVEAAAAIHDIAPDEISAIIGGLDYRLHLLGILNKHIRRGQSVRDIVTSSRIPPFLIKRMLPYAKHYDRSKIQACTTLLVLADSQIQRGERAGVLQSLVALW